MKTTPFWHTALPPRGAPFPGGTQHVDVAIIGGGLSGLSAALHLLERRPGARIAVIEADRVGAGASGRTTGMLSPGVGQSLAALVRRLGPDKARALYTATLAAVREVGALAAREEIDCELRMTGQLVVARSAATRARLEATAALMEPLGLPVQRLDDGALARRLQLSGTAAGHGPAALHLPVAGTLHPGKLLAGLATSVRRRGGIVWEGCRVRTIGDGQPVHLALDAGEVIAAEVVVATGGYTPDLGLLRGRVLPVHLQAIVTEPLTAQTLAAIGWAGREGVIDGRRVFDYYRLTADDRIVFGGGTPRYRWGGRTGDDSERPIARLSRALARTFPSGAPLRVAGGWGGVIAYVADALPAIQRARGHRGVVHVVGWCGHGVALSVASGAWVASILCDGAAPEDLPWFRDRPPLVPFEPARWLGFRAATTMMAALDRLS